jgi:hypothetical protein
VIREWRKEEGTERGKSRFYGVGKSGQEISNIRAKGGGQSEGRSRLTGEGK